MKDITRKLRGGGMYVPWSSDKISGSSAAAIHKNYLKNNKKNK